MDDPDEDDFRKSFTEACELLEGDYADIIEHLYVTTFVDNYEELYIEVDSRYGHNNCRFIVCDQLLDVEVWKSFGRAVRNSKLTFLEVWTRVRNSTLRLDEVEDDLLAAAERCINAFMAEVKHNKSIVEAKLNLTGLSMDDLCEFIINNEALKTLLLINDEPLSLQQSTVLSVAIQSAQLKELVLVLCHFENDGAFERMLEGCSNINVLDVVCRCPSRCNAVAAFLRSPANVLRVLGVCLGNYNQDSAVRNITASLRGNTHLKYLKLFELDDTNHFDELLCDVSSIESSYNSNHSLEKIWIEGHKIWVEGITLSPFAQQCLELNKNEDKDQVAHNKIRQFYFTGEFDVSPFSNMPTSVFPEAMNRIEGKDKLSAIYKLLKCIPELCNSSRRKCTDQYGKKRQKINV